MTPAGARSDEAHDARAELPAIIALCRELEQAPEGCGVLVVADRERADLGSVVIDHGRIVLAMAPEPTKTIELVPDPSQPAIGLRRARRITTRDLRRALLHRAADAIAVLARDGAACDWRPHVTRDYHARSSFAIAEVLAAVIGHAAQGLAESAERAIVESRWIDDESARTVIAAYWLGAPGGVPLPIHVAGDPGFGIAEVLELGRVARDVVRAAGRLDDTAPELVLGGFDACSRAVAAWIDGGAVFAARLDGPSAIERMLAGWHAVSRRE